MTDEQISLLSEYAAAFMNPPEIALMLDIPFEKLQSMLSDKEHPAHIAYNKAKALKKFELRKKVMQMATYGSNSACAMVEQFIIEQSISERDAKI